MNIITISGFIVRDPELKTSKNGTEFCTFTINNKTGYGEKQNSNFFNCITYGINAKNLSQYKKKGDYIYVTGEANISAYTDAEGNKKTNLQITVNNMDFPPHTKVNATEIDRPYNQNVEQNYDGYGKKVAQDAGFFGTPADNISGNDINW